MATIDMTKMPLSASLGITATTASNQIRKNKDDLKWATTAETISKAKYAEIFNMITEAGIRNCGSALDISRSTGLSPKTVQAILDEIAAGTADLAAKEGW